MGGTEKPRGLGENRPFGKALRKGDQHHFLGTPHPLMVPPFFNTFYHQIISIPPRDLINDADPK